MYGVYSWKAGAAAPQIVADLIAIAAGEANVAALSASCEQAQTVIAGAAPGWAAVDAPYGVIGAPGLAGGAGLAARITVSATPKIQLQPVEAWSVGTHAAGYAGTAQDVSLVTSAAGSVHLIVTPEVFLIAASDWSAWALAAECKRDGAILTGGVSGQFQINQANTCTMPRCKSPAAVGDANGPNVTLLSPYGTLAATAVRNRSEALYFPMVPACISYSSAPVGETQGVQVVGGYAASGDYIVDAASDTWRVAKLSTGTLLAVKRA